MCAETRFVSIHNLFGLRDNFFSKMKSCIAVISILLSINAAAAQTVDADEFCAIKDVARYSFGTNCEQYVYCYQSFGAVKVKGLLITCPFGSLFNPVTGDCTLGFVCNPVSTIEPKNELSTFPTTTTTTTTAITTTTPVEVTTTTTERRITLPDETITDDPPVDLAQFCSTRDNKRYPFGTGCRQFIYCYTNVGIQGAMYYCAAPNLFNPVTLSCAPPSSFQCTT